MQQSLSKKFFLISFLPAIAYWYLETRYPVKIAVAGGMALAILELLLEKIFTHHLHALSKFNFLLIAFLGLISFAGDEGIWFKLQPCFTGFGIGGYLLFRLCKGKGLLLEMMQSFQTKTPPAFIFVPLERDLGVFFLLYGLWMGFLALYANTNYWLFFKTLGLYGIFFVFFVIEMVIMRLRVKKEIVRQRQIIAAASFKR